MENWLKKILKGIIYLLALTGLVLVLGFLALRFGLTKTGGLTDLNDRYFEDFSMDSKKDSVNQKIEPDYCKLIVISKLYPSVASGLLEITQQSDHELALAKALEAQEIFLKQDDRYQHGLQICHQEFDEGSFQTDNPYAWQDLSEWQILKEAIVKDQTVIKAAAEKVGIDPRLLVSILSVEQLRLFTSEREVYKQIFQPLKILGTQSKFSWGVMGMKEETAIQVEENLKSPKSVFYLGSDFENLLDFSTNDSSGERFARLTDQHNHYYSYLYSALFLKQIMLQWQKAGYDISGRPEVLATLFNLGFNKSQPKAKPQTGGAEIEINGTNHSFGGLVFQIYYSGELAAVFPLVN